MYDANNSVQTQKSNPEAEMDEWYALQYLQEAMESIRRALPIVWAWGDGQGGYVLSQMRETVINSGFRWPLDPVIQNAKKKDKISRALARRVFERDLYRCVSCGTHLDLCCDHIIPESKGGPTKFENLQTLCRVCNSKKGAKI